MDTKTFNDYMIEWAAQRMVSQGYAQTIEEAKAWLWGRGARPMFLPQNKSFSELGSVRTLERLCCHAYEIIVARRSGFEAELPARVKAYYLPRFQNLAAGRAFDAKVEV